MSAKRDRTIPSPAMQTEPLQDVAQYCYDCAALNAVHKTGGKDANALAELRLACTKCKQGKWGIFKGDAIYTALSFVKEPPKPQGNLTPGRKPTAHKIYGQAVKSLKDEGKSLRVIARTVGISVNTVRKILENDPGE